MTKRGAISSDHTIYMHQCHNAAQRGIEFKLTYDEWLNWWVENLGVDWRNLRGAHRGQYVMARYADTGPYALGNIKCIRHEMNIQEGNRLISDKLARAIFISTDPYKVLMEPHGISFGTIADIRSGRRDWPKITKSLIRSPTHGRNRHKEAPELRS